MSNWPQYAKTIPQYFYESAGKWPEHTAMRYKRDGSWHDIKWKDLEQRALQVAAGLMDMGVGERGVVSILCTNRPEWFYADFGSLSANILNVPIYPTNTPEQVAYILEDSGAEMIFVENQMQLDKVLQFREKLPKLRKAIMIEPYSGGDDFVIDLDALMKAGEKAMDRAAIDGRTKNIDPEDVATLIYTSGTTGNPKGVMLAHRNLVSNIMGIADFMTIEAGEIDLQFLPVCHSFGRMEVFGLLMYQGTVNFAESIEAIPQNFKEIRPTLFVTVPRLLEKVYQKIQSGLEEGSGLKRKLFGWAIGVGTEAVKAKMEKRSISGWLALQHKIADKLVYSKLKEAMGGNIRVLVYGAAPLAKEIQWFFASMGILALEAYGLTETSPGLTGNRADDFQLGTVGKPWRDTEVKIAEDGEVLAKGPQIMLGYWNRPEDTAEAFEGGWFHTGDVGVIDEQGFLHITDRKKDLIITSGGKNIAPQNIENSLMLDEAIEQACVIGDQRKYLSALIVPNFEWLEPFVEDKGIQGPREDWVKHPEVKAELERRIEEKNKGLAKYETIKRFTVLPEEFTIENDMLTPTMKVKRKNVNSIYKDAIEGMYD